MQQFLYGLKMRDAIVFDQFMNSMLWGSLMFSAQTSLAGLVHPNQKEFYENIMENNFVKGVFYQELLVDQINNNLRKIGYVALVLGFFFIVVAVVLIHNTIRLAMYSNRFVIKNMQLVGATWKFITKPYLIKGILNGLWSGIIAIVLLLVLVFLINFQLIYKSRSYLIIW